MDPLPGAIVLPNLLLYALMETHETTVGLKLQETKGVGDNPLCACLEDRLIQTHVFRGSSLTRIQQAPVLHTVTHYEMAIPI